MTFTFHHVHLICSDMEKTIDFFTRMLDATMLEWKNFGTASGATMDVGGAPIFLRTARADEVIAPETCPAHFGYNHICLRVDDLDAVHENLVAKGGEFHQGPTVAADKAFKMAFLAGPDCITVELLQTLN